MYDIITPTLLIGHSIAAKVIIYLRFITWITRCDIMTYLSLPYILCWGS